MHVYGIGGCGNENVQHFNFPTEHNLECYVSDS